MEGCDQVKEETTREKGFPAFPYWGWVQTRWETVGPACIIYETWRILRLNICWFVKSTNMRSCSSPWHRSTADRKNTVAHLIDEKSGWWPEPRRVPLLPRSDGGRRKRGEDRGGVRIRRDGIGLKVTACQSERTVSRKDPPPHICAGLSLCSFSP